jgi:hypothetical protein
MCLHGDRGDVSPETIEAHQKKIRELAKDYELRDIYNADETGLFYQMAPSKTISRRGFSASKKAKIRLSILLCANADGTDKRDPLILGHANKPRCFKKKTGAELGFNYTSNKKAWMTSVIFRDWLEKFNESAKRENRKLLLFVDNASSHNNVEHLSNVQVLYLPPNTTGYLQPMDAGVIACFKRRYRRKQLDHAIDLDEAGVRDIFKVDQLRAMNWIKECWSQVPDDAIANCWKHVAILEAHADHEPRRRTTPESTLDGILLEQMQALRIADPMTIEELLNPEGEDDVHCEDNDEDLIESAMEVDTVENEEEDYAEPTIDERMSMDEQLRVLRDAMSLFDALGGDVSFPVHDIKRDIRRMQRHLRDKKEQKRLKSLRQTPLEWFFSA